MKKSTKKEIPSTEQQINTVLAYHQKELNSIKFPDSEVVDARIAESEELLLSLGIKPKKVESISHRKSKPVMVRCVRLQPNHASISIIILAILLDSQFFLSSHI